MTATLPASAALEAEMRKQIERLDDTIVKVRQNVLVDIGFMDKDVAVLCKRILNADPAVARELEPRMVEMINRLDELAIELKDYQDRVNPQA